MGEPNPTRRNDRDQVDLNQVDFRLDDDAYEEFAILLDYPPLPSDALCALLEAQPPWERQDGE